jgi:hypothetical protein
VTAVQDKDLATAPGFLEMLVQPHGGQCGDREKITLGVCGRVVEAAANVEDAMAREIDQPEVVGAAGCAEPRDPPAHRVDGRVKYRVDVEAADRRILEDFGKIFGISAR